MIRLTGPNPKPDDLQPQNVHNTYTSIPAVANVQPADALPNG